MEDYTKIEYGHSNIFILVVIVVGRVYYVENRKRLLGEVFLANSNMLTKHGTYPQFYLARNSVSKEFTP